MLQLNIVKRLLSLAVFIIFLAGIFTGNATSAVRQNKQSQKAAFYNHYQFYLAQLSKKRRRRSSWRPQPSQTWLGSSSQQPDKKTLSLAPKITYPRENGNGQVGAYFCLPQGKGPFPAVIYNHGGRGDKIGGAPEATCQALAEAGFVGLTPLYTPGIAWGGYISDIFSAIKYLRQHPQVDGSHLAIMGFSRGGAATLETSVFRPDDFKAIVLMAPAPGENNSLAANLPYVNKIGAPVLIQVAEDDRAAPVDHLALAKTADQALRAASKNSQLIVYPAGNGGHQMFFKLGGYWKDTLAFLQNNLATAPFKTTAVDDAAHQKLKELKQEVAGFHKHQMPTEEHYHRIEKDLVWLEQRGAPAEELAVIRRLVEPWNPLVIAEGDRARQAIREEGEKKRASQMDGVLSPESGCRNDRPVLAYDFTDFSKIKKLTAPGTLTNDRDVAKGHFWIWTTGRVPVYVPIDAVLESINSGSQGGVTHYTLEFRVNDHCSFVFRFAHITEPDLSLTPGAVVPAGTQVGYTVGNIPSGNWDLGWYDLANEGPLAKINAFGRHRFGLCWVDYYSPEKQSSYRQLLEGPRTVCQW